MECLVFSYGSNLYLPRLLSRVGKAQFVSIAVLPDYQLSFRKLGRDGSGKATVSKQKNQVVWGSVCALSQDAKRLLDRCEGIGLHYVEQGVEVFTPEGQTLSVFTYQAASHKIQEGLKPFHWYKQYLLKGGELLNLPTFYQQQLVQMDSIPDHDAERAQLHQLVVKK
ncbi:MAG: gamma-glutamylcyclotransferase family protein [Flammeovirgaceae bacterium]